MTSVYLLVLFLIFAGAMLFLFIAYSILGYPGPMG